MEMGPVIAIPLRRSLFRLDSRVRSAEYRGLFRTEPGDRASLKRSRFISVFFFFSGVRSLPARLVTKLSYPSLQTNALLGRGGGIQETRVTDICKRLIYS